MRSLDEFEKKIGYKFKNRNLLITALTHSSYANESRGGDQSYERLEFLGDSILGVCHGGIPVQSVPGYSRRQADKEACGARMRKIALRVYTQLRRRRAAASQPRRAAQRRQRTPKHLSGRIRIHYGSNLSRFRSLEEAKRFVLHYIEPAAQSAGERPFKDHKTMLQEIIQQNPGERLEYVLTGEHGPDHDKHFTVEVHLNSNVIGKGGGRSKKEAEQQAAREALELMGY